jgi:hypothetical protein
MDSSHISDNIQRAIDELAKLKTEVTLYRIDPTSLSPVADPERLLKSSISMSLQTVYSNIENVFELLLKASDNYRGSGDSFHKEILERASSPIEGVRPAIISQDLKSLLVHLLGFRHFVRKQYAFEVKLNLALENFDRAEQALPMLKIEIQSYLSTMAPGDHSGEDGQPGGVTARKKKGNRSSP